MYPIGIFSKMNQITSKTLRLYDEMGLLKPAFVDENTGYRYYSSSQLSDLSQIMTLKHLGFSLSEIKKLQESPSRVNHLLEEREKEVLQSIEEEKIKLRSIRSYQKRLKGAFMMDYNPVIRSLPQVIVASMRMIAPSYDHYFHTIPKMGDEMRRLGAVCAQPAYCFNIYHDGDYRDKDIDVEVCEAVVDYCPSSDMVTFKTIPGVDQALCLLHKGPYDTLRDAYAFAMTWIEDNHYQLDGLPRESYIDGIWNKSSDQDWLTELQIPIKKI